MKSRIALLVVASALAAAGCTSRPRAPALHGESFYQDDREGFRFEPPAGWGMTARTALPADQPVTQERKLVEYKFANPTKPASFTVSRLDDAGAIDLLAQFAANRSAPDGWRVVKPIAPITTDGVQGQSLTLTSGAGPKAMIKDVTAFHRDGRHYFFVLLCNPDDVAARDAGRRAIATLSWKPK